MLMTDKNYETTSLIETIKKRLTEQQKVIENAQYIESLIYNDLLTICRTPKNHFDYLDESTFFKACMEQNTKLKKDKQNYLFLKSLIEKNICNDNQIEIISISRCGYEGYGYEFRFEYCKQVFTLFVPILAQMCSNNFDSMHEGKLTLFKTEDWISSSIISSYKEDNIRIGLEEYLKNNEINT